MSNRLWRTAALACAVVCLAAPASAQQTVNFSLGWFAPKGYESRVTGDVLVVNSSFLIFDLDDFGSGAVGGEWLLPLGRFLEAGAGLQYTQQTVPSVYADYVAPDGSEVYQETRLRRVPIDFTVRVLPFGQDIAVQPYFGGGVTVMNWHYKEFGEFIDFDAGRRIIVGEFSDDGTQVGAVVLGGIRFSLPSLSAGFEFRYHHADAPLSNDFAGPRLDLGGWTYQATAGLRF